MKEITLIMKTSRRKILASGFLGTLASLFISRNAEAKETHRDNLDNLPVVYVKSKDDLYHRFWRKEGQIEDLFQNIEWTVKGNNIYREVKIWIPEYCLVKILTRKYHWGEMILEEVVSHFDGGISSFYSLRTTEKSYSVKFANDTRYLNKNEKQKIQKLKEVFCNKEGIYENIA